MRHQSLGRALMPLFMGALFLTIPLMGVDELFSNLTQLLAIPEQGEEAVTSSSELSPALANILNVAFQTFGTLMALVGTWNLLRYIMFNLNGNPGAPRKTDKKEEKAAKKSILLDSAAMLAKAKELDAKTVSLWFDLNSDLDRILSTYPMLYAKFDDSIHVTLLASLNDLDAARTKDEAKAENYLEVAERVHKDLLAALKKVKGKKSAFTQQQRVQMDVATKALKSGSVEEQAKVLSSVAEFLQIPQEAMKRHKALSKSAATSGMLPASSLKQITQK